MARQEETVYYNTDDSKKQEIKGKWWGEDPKEQHRHIKAVVGQIRQHQSYREVLNLRYARLYANQMMVGLTGGDFARTGAENVRSMNANTISWNVSKAAIDTLSSKIAKNKPKPLYLTDDADWMLQQKAENLTRFMQSQFLSMGTGQGDNRSLYGVGRQGFVDACIFGLGVTKFFKEDGQIYAERVLPHEIIVDDVEGRYQCPRQLHQVKLLPRELLCDMYPQHAGAIESAQSGIKGESHNSSSADVVEVIESWHLPSGENAKDGSHVISIENKTLFHEEWRHDFFPFLFQRWNNNVIGFYGIGVCEELMGIQLDINKSLRRIAQAQHLMAVPQVWLEYQSKTVTSKLNNLVGGQRYYQGARPYFLVPPAMSSEVYQHLENQYRKAFEIVGVSQLSAQGKKPSGLDSGVALREFQDIESERFALAQLRYEDFYMDAADLIKKLMRDMKEHDGIDPVVQCHIEGGGIESLKWSDVDIPDDRCAARPYPTNFLSSTPAGKLQEVQELLQAGMLSQEEGLELLDYPDVNSAKSEKLAPREANRLVIESALIKGKYVQPEPFMDLQTLLPMAQNYYLRAKVKGAPEDRLELLRRLMDDVNALLNPEPEEPPMPEAPMDPAAAGMDPAAQAMQDPMAAGQPMAQPEALPTSDLLPMG